MDLKNSHQSLIPSFIKGAPTKRKHVYDELSRLVEIYEAVFNAPHGGPCLKTTYTYVGNTGLVDTSIETLAQWDSSWG